MSSAALPQLTFYTNVVLSASLSHRPTLQGQTQVVLNDAESALFSLTQDKFVTILLTLRDLAKVLQDHYEVPRCALITEGNNVITLLPLHGLTSTWKSMTSDEEEYHISYPGYITSKNGPEMHPDTLNQISTRIRQVSQLSEPYNTSFHGPHPPKTSYLFANLITTPSHPQYRIWESSAHVAFLTPYPNTPGYTVLVPRKHLPSDIFSISDLNDYTGLMKATHVVANVLKRALSIEQCGMIFEGLEIDHAHVKIVPIHRGSMHEEFDSAVRTGMGSARAIYYADRYPGFVTSQPGPLVGDLDLLLRHAEFLRKAVRDGGLQSG